MGNIYCRLEPNGGGGTPLFFCAHLDTVPPEGADRAGRGRRRGRAQRAPARSSAPTTSRPSPRCSRPPRGWSRTAGRTPGSSCSSRRRRRSACSARPPSTRIGSRRDFGYVYDQAGPIGEIDPRRAAPAEARCPIPRPRGALGHVSRRTAAPRSPPRRVRSPTCGSGGSTRRPTANVGRISGGTARNIVPEWCAFAAEARSPRRAQARRPDPGDARDRHLRRESRGVRGRDAGVRASRAATASAATTRRCGSRRRRSSGRGTSPRTSSRAAAPTRTSSTSAACSASTSPTG